MDPSVTLWQMDWKQKGLADATMKHMTRELLRFQRWLAENATVERFEDATYQHCLLYLNARSQDGTCTAANSWRAMRCFYLYLEALDGTPNPMAKVKCPRRPEPVTKGVTPGEYKQLLLACGSDARDKAIVSLLYSTGLRRTELATLKTEDINPDQRVLLVRRSKTGKPRVVPFSAEAAQFLLKYLRIRNKHKLAADPHLWLGKKGVLSTEGIRLMLKRRANIAGVDVTAHQFRRAFAVSWLEHGGSQVSLMHICGWTNTAMPARYVRHAGERLAEAEYKRIYG